MNRLTSRFLERKYVQLQDFKELEKLQAELNRAHLARDKKRKAIAVQKVLEKEREINEKFDLNRKHTGIKLIRADVAELEEEVGDYVAPAKSENIATIASKTEAEHNLLQEYFKYKKKFEKMVL